MNNPACLSLASASVNRAAHRACHEIQVAELVKVVRYRISRNLGIEHPMRPLLHRDAVSVIAEDLSIGQPDAPLLPATEVDAVHHVGSGR